MSTTQRPLTAGELGTRGTPDTRAAEAAAASALLGLSLRRCLHLPDGFFVNGEAHQRAVIAAVRQHRPRLVIANATRDRHPDHGRGHALVRDACFLAGLRRIETLDAQSRPQEPWRPARVLGMIQDQALEPSLVVDVSAYWEQKLEAIRAYRTQFYDPGSTEPSTHISQPTYFDFLRSRARTLGHQIGVEYGEGFTLEGPVRVDDLMTLI